MKLFTGMKNSRYSAQIINALFIAVLALYPMRHVNIGLDLWDTGYNYSNFEYMGPGSMDSMWLFSTYLSTALGHLFTLLPFGKTLIGMNVYTALLPAGTAVISFIFCTRKLEMDPIPVFLGEMISLSLCWCPTSLIYNFLTYLFMHLALIFMYMGMSDDRLPFMAVPGALIGLNVFVRFSNLPEIIFIIAIWAYGVVCVLRKRKEVRPAFSDELKKAAVRTLVFLGGYIAAIAIMLGFIGIRYGIGEYISGIKRLFDIPRLSYHYSSKEMLASVIFGYLRNTKWVLALLAFAAVSGLFAFLAGRAGAREKKSVSAVMWVLCLMTSVSSVAFLFLTGFFSGRSTDGASLEIPGTVLTYLMMLLGVYVIFAGFKDFSEKDKLLAGLVILLILVTPIGSNNGIVLTFNNLFIALPWFICTCFKAFGKPVMAAAGSVIAAFCAVCFVRFAIFGANYVFVDAQPAVNADHRVDAPATLKGVRMSEERAEAVSGLYEYVSEKDLYGKSEIITYGFIPSLSFYLQMPPAFNSWPDLESYSEDVMRKDVGEYIRIADNGNGELPLIVVSSDYSEYMASTEMTGNGKLDVIKELLWAGEYTSEYKNEMFEAFYPGIKGK